MCGRAAHSERATSTAAAALSTGRVIGRPTPDDDADGGAAVEHGLLSHGPNAGPGNAFRVFHKAIKGGKEAVSCSTMIWGLLPKNGTPDEPHLLPTDPNFSVSPHYKMFNARSETVYNKQSFNGLLRRGQTCVVPLEGYYEWTTSQSLSDKRKQPYYVRRKDKQQVLLMAGLWSRVRTGRKMRNPDSGSVEDETIATFAILTADAHPKYSWLHPRQPVMLWDIDVALEWLREPTPSTVSKLRCIPTTDESLWETSLSVYSVSKKVNDVKYQGDDCTVEVTLEKAPSIKSFFRPREAKKPKIEVKEVEEDNCLVSQQKPASESQPSPRGESVGTFSSEKESSSDQKQWTCSKCTYVHIGSEKSEYLACEVCLSERSLNKDGI